MSVYIKRNRTQKAQGVVNKRNATVAGWLRAGHDRIARARESRARGSWWIDADRIAFTSLAEGERARMAASKFGGLNAMTCD